MATLSEVVQFLTTPKPQGATFMGQVTATPDLGNGRFGLTGSITNAQALALNSAPVDTVPAIPNMIILPTFIVWRVNYVAAYGTNVNVVPRLSGVAVDLMTTLQIIFNALPHVDQILMSDMIQSVNPFASGVDLRNRALQMFGTADTTLGDVGNTFNFFLEYRVIDRP